jgi:hypothetical protein
MDSDLDRRIARVLAERERERAATHASEPDRERREARQRAIAELPKLESKLAGAVAELNDVLSRSGLAVRFERAKHTPSAEAIFTCGVLGRGQAGPVLVMSVDFTGRISTVLRTGDHSSHLETVDIFSIERESLMDLLIALLEAHYPPARS